MEATQQKKTFVEGTVTHVPLKAIIDHEEILHRPLDKEWVNELAKDIERNGLTVPLIVWNGGGKKGQQVELENGKIIPATFLIAGLHRRAAIRSILKANQPRYKELFPDGVPVHVLGGEEQDALAALLRENVQRKDMDMAQILPIISKMRDEYGMKQKDIAAKIGKSAAWVSQVFDIEEELGEEGSEELKKGGVSMSDAREAAGKVRKAKKAGKPVSAKDELQKAKAKKAALKAKGREREERRVSAKTVWKRYSALPKMNMGAKLTVAENALGYLAGDEEFDLPPELQADTEEEGKDESDE
jgi:ParB-like chromosome segregation protein Spo0J